MPFDTICVTFAEKENTASTMAGSSVSETEQPESEDAKKEQASEDQDEPPAKRSKTEEAIEAKENKVKVCAIIPTEQHLNII